MLQLQISFQNRVPAEDSLKTTEVLQALPCTDGAPATQTQQDSHLPEFTQALCGQTKTRHGSALLSRFGYRGDPTPTSRSPTPHGFCCRLGHLAWGSTRGFQSRRSPGTATPEAAHSSSLRLGFPSLGRCRLEVSTVRASPCCMGPWFWAPGKHQQGLRLPPRPALPRRDERHEDTAGKRGEGAEARAGGSAPEAVI